MRRILILLVPLLAAALCCGTGCAGRKKNAPAGVEQPRANKTRSKPAPRVLAASEMAGRVVKVNPTARFVVLNFPVGTLPESGANFGLFRGGLKVADVRITGPQLDDNVVADVLAGDAQPGDEARVP